MFLTPPIEAYPATSVKKNFVTTKFWRTFISSHLILAIVPLSFISAWILCEFAMLVDVSIHFTVPSGRRGALFFLWEQMYTSGSTFIKKIKPVVCHYISMPRSSNVYIKRINSTIQARNSTVLWWLLWYQVILYNSNIFGISINVSKQSFPN